MKPRLLFAIVVMHERSIQLAMKDVSDKAQESKNPMAIQRTEEALDNLRDFMSCLEDVARALEA